MVSFLEGFEQVAARLECVVRRRRASGSEAEERLKGRHRLPSPIVPKDELVQIDLQLGAAHPVVGADQPLLEVPDGAVRQRHHGFRALAQRRFSAVACAAMCLKPAASKPVKVFRPSVKIVEPGATFWMTKVVHAWSP